MPSRDRQVLARLVIAGVLCGAIGFLIILATRHLAALWGISLSGIYLVGIYLFVFSVLIRCAAPVIFGSPDEKYEREVHVTSEALGVGSPSEPGIGRIRIVRPSASVDSRRSYQVMLDGDGAGSVNAGQELVVDVPTGPHRLSLKIDWCGSNVVLTDVGPGSQLTFYALSGINGLGSWYLLWCMAFRPKSYLKLEPKSEVD